jgi:ring-1,2-phenylacetyl-CoA epoxidase subunit PaaD
MCIRDRGIITEVESGPDGVRVEMIPTFSGCHALGFMQLHVEECLRAQGIERVQVRVNRNKAWSSDYLTEAGREGLRAHGLALPPRSADGPDEPAECPKCGSHQTRLLSPFGPTLCRAIHHCTDCLETFEQFKPV